MHEHGWRELTIGDDDEALSMETGSAGVVRYLVIRALPITMCYSKRKGTTVVLVGGERGTFCYVQTDSCKLNCRGVSIPALNLRTWMLNS